MWIEVIGYTGMGFVLLSFLMRKILWVRIVNMIGATLSLIYGILTMTIPTAALNGSLLAINAVFVSIFFIREYQDKKKKEKEKSTTENVVEEKQEEK